MQPQKPGDKSSEKLQKILTEQGNGVHYSPLAHLRAAHLRISSPWFNAPSTVTCCLQLHPPELWVVFVTQPSGRTTLTIIPFQGSVKVSLDKLLFQAGLCFMSKAVPLPQWLVGETRLCPLRQDPVQGPLLYNCGLLTPSPGCYFLGLSVASSFKPLGIPPI